MADGVEDNVPTAIFDEKIVLIGDLHGNLQETLLLWERIEDHLGKDVLSEATVTFLGDYVDKGPDSRGVIDFLVQLQQKRQTGKTHFICGNRDFGMACYLGCMPADDDSSSKDEKVLALDKTQRPKHSVQNTSMVSTRIRWREECITRVEDGVHTRRRRHSRVTALRMT